MPLRRGVLLHGLRAGAVIQPRLLGHCSPPSATAARSQLQTASRMRRLADCSQATACTSTVQRRCRSAQRLQLRSQGGQRETRSLQSPGCRRWRRSPSPSARPSAARRRGGPRRLPSHAHRGKAHKTTGPARRGGQPPYARRGVSDVRECDDWWLVPTARSHAPRPRHRTRGKGSFVLTSRRLHTRRSEYTQNGVNRRHTGRVHRCGRYHSGGRGGDAR